MGCMHSKGSAVEDSRESPKDGGLSSRRSLRELKTSRLGSSTEEIGYNVKDKVGDVNVMLFDQKVNDSTRLRGDLIQKLEDDRDCGEKHRRTKAEKGAVVGYESISWVPKAAEGEQVAAGWPSCLSAAAGEAVQGWLAVMTP